MQRRVSRNIAIGMVSGILIGLALYFIFPGILSSEVAYKGAMREGLGYGEDSYSVTGGSSFVATFLIPLVVGILGGFLGWVYSLLTKPTKHS